MKFSEIKDKIKNLGNYKSLDEIKRDDLRVCKNPKYGDYWLIEKDYLKPVVIDYENCETNKLNPNMVLFSFPEIDYSTVAWKACDYIAWGNTIETKGKQKQVAGIALSQTSSLKGRRFWYSFSTPDVESDIFWQKRTGERFAVFFSENKIYSDQKFYPFISYVSNKASLVASLNSIVQRLFFETLSMSYTGAFTLIEISVEDVENLPCVDPSALGSISENDLEIPFQSIFKDLGIEKNEAVTNLQVYADRVKIDKAVFDAIGLNKAEQKQVYLEVANQVNKRLKKSSSTGE